MATIRNTPGGTPVNVGGLAGGGGAGTWGMFEQGAQMASQALNSLVQSQDEFIRSSPQLVAKVKETAKELKEMTDEARAAADAFGSLGNGMSLIKGTLSEVAAAASLTQWEIRHATQATQEMTPAMGDLIERLAALNDSFGHGPQTVFLGQWIAQLEQGQLSMAEFMAKVEALFAQLMQLGGVAAEPLMRQLQQIRSLLQGLGAESQQEMQQLGAAAAEASEEVDALASGIASVRGEGSVSSSSSGGIGGGGASRDVTATGVRRGSGPPRINVQLYRDQLKRQRGGRE